MKWNNDIIRIKFIYYGAYLTVIITFAQSWIHAFKNDSEVILSENSSYEIIPAPGAKFC